MTHLGAKRRSFVCAASIALCLAASAGAQEPVKQDAGVTPAAVEAPNAPVIDIEAVKKQTRQIRALMRGRLDVTVDPNTLFAVDLNTLEAGTLLESLLKELEDKTGTDGSRTDRKRAARPPLPDPAQEALRQLNEAKAAFLSLPVAKRREILARHEERRKKAVARAEETRAKTELLDKLQTQADDMQAFLDGNLDPSVDPASLLKVDLADLEDLASDDERRRRFLEPGAATMPRAPGEEASLDAQIDAARQRRDALWLRFLALDSDARRALLAKHEAQVSGGPNPAAQAAEAKRVAKQAAQERERALSDSQLGHTEAMRLLADRRARLLAIKEAQANFQAELAARRTELDATTEAALAWNRRVRELSESLPPGDARANEANDLYRSLTKDLSDMRGQLSFALDAVRSEPSHVPAPGDDADEVPANLDDTTLRDLRADLSRSAFSLQAAEGELRWEHARALRDAIVIMNQSRLRLFGMLGKAQRDRLEGFGPEGVAQVERELSTIVLEARFHLLSLPRELTRGVRSLRATPGPAFVAFAELFFAVLLFRWWRKRADPTLEDWRRSWLQKRPQTELTRGVATSIWYLKRIREPLEWGALIVVLVGLVARAGHLPETKYLRIFITWLLAGAIVTQWVDAIASRQGFSTEASAKLRFRSLRMVGISVVAIGLILSLTVATVGKGAIYAWVIRSLWVLAIPIVVILVLWWKDVIFERAKNRESSRLLQWVAAQEHGLLQFPAAMIGGAVLLVQGVVAFLVRRVTALAPLRRVFAYLFRRGVEKTTAAAPAESGTEALPAEQLQEAFGSRLPTPEELVTAYMSDQVHAMRALVRSDNSAIVAVIGERGRGKTTFLNRITSDLEPGELCSVQCEPGGFSVLLRGFARALGLPETSTEEEIISALCERAPRVICVDDAQRLVRPLIGGLEDMDHLVRFTRMINPKTSWLIAIGMPAWQYLLRARGDRAAFDRVIELEPWEDAQVAALVRHRSASAGIDPSFEGLAVPRQFQTSTVSEEERTETDFYRIIWDYSDGNPAVALHCWQGSLYRRPPDETVRVRLFPRPSASDLDDLPSTFYFVLRTVVQLERAAEQDVITCTDLSAAEVADALRAARLRGYVRENGDLFEVDIHWYRAITSILRRKHLLVV